MSKTNRAKKLIGSKIRINGNSLLTVTDVVLRKVVSKVKPPKAPYYEQMLLCDEIGLNFYSKTRDVDLEQCPEIHAKFKRMDDLYEIAMAQWVKDENIVTAYGSYLYRERENALLFSCRNDEGDEKFVHVPRRVKYTDEGFIDIT